MQPTKPSNTDEIRAVDLPLSSYTKVANWLANFMICAIMLFVSLYFVISLCVMFFKLTGQLKEGQPMFFELQTPTWTSLVEFQGACIAILGVGFFMRHMLQRNREQPQ